MWVQKIKAASEHFIETEKKKREKAYQGNKASNGGALVITLKLHRLKSRIENGRKGSLELPDIAKRLLRLHEAAFQAI